MTKAEQDNIITGVIDGLAKHGYGLVKIDQSDPVAALEKAKQRIMRRSKLTPYQIAKFDLIGKSSLKTIKRMVVDGRIKPHEQLRDTSGKLYITIEGVKRLQNEL